MELPLFKLPPFYRVFTRDYLSITHYRGLGGKTKSGNSQLSAWKAQGGRSIERDTRTAVKGTALSLGSWHSTSAIAVRLEMYVSWRQSTSLVSKSLDVYYHIITGEFPENFAFSGVARESRYFPAFSSPHSRRHFSHKKILLTVIQPSYG